MPVFKYYPFAINLPLTFLSFSHTPVLLQNLERDNFFVLSLYRQAII